MNIWTFKYISIILVRFLVLFKKLLKLGLVVTLIIRHSSSKQIFKFSTFLLDSYLLVTTGLRECPMCSYVIIQCLHPNHSDSTFLTDRQLSIVHHLSVSLLERLGELKKRYIQNHLLLNLWLQLLLFLLQP